MSLSAGGVVLFSLGCLLVVVGTASLTPWVRHVRSSSVKSAFLVLIFAVALLPLVSHPQTAYTTPSVSLDNVHLLTSRTVVAPLGPSALGLHAHFAASSNARAFLSSARIRSLAASSTIQRSSILDSTFSPEVRRNGQPIGLDHWFSDAITPVKPPVVFLC